MEPKPNTGKDRVILHCDCNSFYASVAALSHPEYQNCPLAVGGDPTRRHGIILAKNQLAKSFGVETAEPLWKARQKCPHLVILPPDFGAYHQISKRVNEIYQRYTDLVEPYGLDETFLDVTGTLHLFGLDGKGLADRLRKEVFEEIGITISVGVSFTKSFAKVGSDFKKPDATTCFLREHLMDSLYPLEVERLLFVGKRTQKVLFDLGIHTIGQLAVADPLLLQKKMGKLGLSLSKMARGEEEDPVQSVDAKREAKSIGNGMTFRRDLQNMEEFHLALSFLAESVATRMKKEGVNCGTLQVSYKTYDFETKSKQIPCPIPTNLAPELVALAKQLLGNLDFKKPIRALTLTATHLTPLGEAEQLGLFEGEEIKKHKRLEKLEDTLFSIRQRYGEHAIERGDLFRNTLEEDLDVSPSQFPPPLQRK